MNDFDLYGICSECQIESFHENKGMNYVYMCPGCGCTMEYDEFSIEVMDSL